MVPRAHWRQWRKDKTMRYHDNDEATITRRTNAAAQRVNDCASAPQLTSASETKSQETRRGDADAYRRRRAERAATERDDLLSQHISERESRPNQRATELRTTDGDATDGATLTAVTIAAPTSNN